MRPVELPFDIDFAARGIARVRLSVAALTVFAAGIVSVAGAAAVLAPRFAQHRWLQSATAAIDGSLAEARRARLPARDDKAKPADMAALAEARRIATDLHRPWGALFDVVESVSSGRVHVTQIGVDAQFHGIQIQVEARALGDVVRYAQSLAAAGAPIAGAQLASHEWTGTAVRVVSARVTVALDPRPRTGSAAGPAPLGLMARSAE